MKWLVQDHTAKEGTGQDLQPRAPAPRVRPYPLLQEGLQAEPPGGSGLSAGPAGSQLLGQGPPEDAHGPCPEPGTKPARGSGVSHVRTAWQAFPGGSSGDACTPRALEPRNGARQGHGG